MSSRPLLSKADIDRDILFYRWSCMPLRSACLSEWQLKKANESIARSEGGAVNDWSLEKANALPPMLSSVLSARFIRLSDENIKAPFPIDFGAYGKLTSSVLLSSE